MAGIDGILDATTGGGNVELKDCSGQLNATTGGGNVELEKVSGSLEGHTGAGNIEAKDCTASLWLSTGNGNIELEKLGARWMAAPVAVILKQPIARAVESQCWDGKHGIDRFTGPSVTGRPGRATYRGFARSAEGRSHFAARWATWMSRSSRRLP